jgi:predicted ArsR family transcriptional regulator
MDNHDDAQLYGIAALAEPARRALYDFVASQPAAVGREEAAAAVGVTRAVAAFHLDRLVVLGLLETESRRLTGRQGPGAGRPAKLYRRAHRDFAVSVPPRRYELAAQLLAEAVQRATETGTDVAARLAESARERGRALGETVCTRLRDRTSRRALVESIDATLSEQGYEPRADTGEILLGNCPFDALADSHRELVCGMNLDLLSGLAEVLPEGRVAARLEPAEGCCCVRLHVEA